ncbi:MAG TPA: hypothetical protein ENN17_04285 [bacterium]|nr:hypothetical protein [bacterium]
MVAGHSSGQAGGDSTAVQEEPVRYPSPKGAVIRSALLAGWGQWYNGRKLKSLLVLGGEAGLIANAVIQNQKVQRSATLEERRFYENNRGLSIWWAAAVYFLNLLDAYVDAALSDFDVGPDLTWRYSGFGGRGIVLSVSWDFPGMR